MPQGHIYVQKVIVLEAPNTVGFPQLDVTGTTVSREAVTSSIEALCALPSQPYAPLITRPPSRALRRELVQTEGAANILPCRKVLLVIAWPRRRILFVQLRPGPSACSEVDCGDNSNEQKKGRKKLETPPLPIHGLRDYQLVLIRAKCFSHGAGTPAASSTCLPCNMLW